MTSVRIGIWLNVASNRYHIALKHDDGSEEVSDQSFETREECEAAIEQYIKDRGAQIQRDQ